MPQKVSRHCTGTRSAFALTELVVTILVVGLLLTIVLPAISYTREAMRRVDCTNRLRQIGLALQNYHQSHRVFPRLALPNGSGPLVAILPYIERGDVYSTIDFDLAYIDFNRSLVGLKIDLYRCPSTEAQDRARTDYVFNRGTSLGSVRNGPWMDESDETNSQFPKLGSFSRGSARTALVSEACPSTNTSNIGAVWKMPRSSRVDQVGDEIINRCVNLSTLTKSDLDNGSTWLGLAVANYYHILNPCDRSCGNGNLVQSSLFTPVSLHSKGVNVLFADGHIEYQASTIDSNVWRDIGTR